MCVEILPISEIVRTLVGFFPFFFFFSVLMIYLNLCANPAALLQFSLQCVCSGIDRFELQSFNYLFVLSNIPH